MKNKMNKFKSDKEFSRETYYDLIGSGRDAIEEMMEVCRQTQHPRAFEVLSKLIKDTGEINDKLVDVHVKEEQLKNSKQKRNGKELPKGNTNVFIGTTTDLQRMLHAEPIDVTPEKVESKIKDE